MTDTLCTSYKNNLNKIIITGFTCCFYCKTNLAFEFSSGSEVAISESAAFENVGTELQALALDTEQWKCLKSLQTAYSSSDFSSNNDLLQSLDSLPLPDEWGSYGYLPKELSLSYSLSLCPPEPPDPDTAKDTFSSASIDVAPNRCQVLVPPNFDLASLTRLTPENCTFYLFPAHYYFSEIVKPKINHHFIGFMGPKPVQPLFNSVVLPLFFYLSAQEKSSVFSVSVIFRSPASFTPAMPVLHYSGDSELSALMQMTNGIHLQNLILDLNSLNPLANSSCQEFLTSVSTQFTIKNVLLADGFPCSPYFQPESIQYKADNKGSKVIRIDPAELMTETEMMEPPPSPPASGDDENENKKPTRSEGKGHAPKGYSSPSGKGNKASGGGDAGGHGNGERDGDEDETFGEELSETEALLAQISLLNSIYRWLISDPKNFQKNLALLAQWIDQEMPDLIPIFNQALYKTLKLRKPKPEKYKSATKYLGKISESQLKNMARQFQLVQALTEGVFATQTYAMIINLHWFLNDHGTSIQWRSARHDIIEITMPDREHIPTPRPQTENTTEPEPRPTSADKPPTATNQQSQNSAEQLVEYIQSQSSSMGALKRILAWLQKHHPDQATNFMRVIRSSLSDGHHAASGELTELSLQTLQQLTSPDTLPTVIYNLILLIPNGQSDLLAQFQTTKATETESRPPKPGEVRAYEKNNRADYIKALYEWILRKPESESDDYDKLLRKRVYRLVIALIETGAEVNLDHLFKEMRVINRAEFNRLAAEHGSEEAALMHYTPVSTAIKDRVAGPELVNIIIQDLPTQYWAEVVSLVSNTATSSQPASVSPAEQCTSLMGGNFTVALANFVYIFSSSPEVLEALVLTMNQHLPEEVVISADWLTTSFMQNPFPHDNAANSVLTSSQTVHTFCAELMANIEAQQQMPQLVITTYKSNLTGIKSSLERWLKRLVQKKGYLSIDILLGLFKDLPDAQTQLINGVNQIFGTRFTNGGGRLALTIPADQTALQSTFTSRQTRLIRRIMREIPYHSLARASIVYRQQRRSGRRRDRGRNQRQEQTVHEGTPLSDASGLSQGLSQGLSWMEAGSDTESTQSFAPSFTSSVALTRLHAARPDTEQAEPSEDQTRLLEAIQQRFEASPSPSKSTMFQDLLIAFHKLLLEYKLDHEAGLLIKMMKPFINALDDSMFAVNVTSENFETVLRQSLQTNMGQSQLKTLYLMSVKELNLVLGGKLHTVLKDIVYSLEPDIAQQLLAVWNAESALVARKAVRPGRPGRRDHPTYTLVRPVNSGGRHSLKENDLLHRQPARAGGYSSETDLDPTGRQANQWQSQLDIAPPFALSQTGPVNPLQNGASKFRRVPPRMNNQNPLYPLRRAAPRPANQLPSDQLPSNQPLSQPNPPPTSPEVEVDIPETLIQSPVPLQTAQESLVSFVIPDKYQQLLRSRRQRLLTAWANIRFQPKKREDRIRDLIIESIEVHKLHASYQNLQQLIQSLLAKRHLNSFTSVFLPHCNSLTQVMEFIQVLRVAQYYLETSGQAARTKKDFNLIPLTGSAEALLSWAVNHFFTAVEDESRGSTRAMTIALIEVLTEEQLAQLISTLQQSETTPAVQPVQRARLNAPRQDVRQPPLPSEPQLSDSSLIQALSVLMQHYPAINPALGSFLEPYANAIAQEMGLDDQHTAQSLWYLLSQEIRQGEARQLNRFWRQARNVIPPIDWATFKQLISDWYRKAPKSGGASSTV